MTQKAAMAYDTLSTSDCAVHNLPRRAARVRSHGISPDREVLMHLLSRCLPLVKAAVATTVLLDRYNNYAEVVAAPFNELRALACLGEHGAHLLKCVHAAAIHLAAAPLQRATSINDWTSLSAYLNTSMAREKNEVLRVLFLDVKNHVISDQILGIGTTAAVSVSVRNIAEKSLQIGAMSILILHNHPSGDPTPSEQDFVMTKRIENMLSLIDIRLHDHIIVGKGRFYSLKEMRFMPDYNGKFKKSVRVAS